MAPVHYGKSRTGRGSGIAMPSRRRESSFFRMAPPAKDIVDELDALAARRLILMRTPD